MEEVEWKKRKDDVNFFMRVRVALPISKPFRRGRFIAGTDGEHYLVDFKYERLLIFCHYCGILWHDLKHYVAHYTAEKNGGSGEYQYGVSLRATGGCARVSTSQFTGNKSSSAEGVGRDSMKFFDQRVQGLREMAAAREEDQVNPSMDDKDESENLGNAAGITCAEGADHENVKEVDYRVKCLV